MVMTIRGRLFVMVCTALAAGAATTGAGQPPAGAQPQGWAVRASMSNPSAKLYNNAKQKLLDGKQIFTYTISRLDVKLYCEVAQHYDYIWFEMQHSTMSYRDVEEMIAACPRPPATPIIRVPDEFESSIQKATDIGALGIVVPTVDTVEKAIASARFARYPPQGRRSMGAGQAAAIWGGNGVNYRDTFNDNMLVIVQIETPVGVANAYDIAMVPGVDVLLGSNGDMTNFSGCSRIIRSIRTTSRRSTTPRSRPASFSAPSRRPTPRRVRLEWAAPTSPTGGCSTTGRRSTGSSRREPEPARK